MRIDVLTLFPNMFTGPFDASILGRARRDGLVEVNVWDIREHTKDRHRTADDAPYGGGPGMVMKPEPVVEAVEHVIAQGPADIRPWVILLAPQGRRFDQRIAEEYAQLPWLILICGHYEGVDDRVRQLVADEVLSIGDFVLTGGEPAAIVVVDAVVRLIPGVLGEAASVHEESFGRDMLLEYPQYTRPVEYRGLRVPDVLLSGNHAAIRRWRRKESLRLTRLIRPDLLERAVLSDEDRALLLEIERELAESGPAGAGPCRQGVEK